MTRRLILTLAGLTLAGSIACFNTDQKGDPDSFATDSLMKMLEVSNGFGRLLPYVIAVPDPLTGAPSAQLIEIRTMEDLLNNPPSENNPILPPASWPISTINPAGRTGNHYVAVRFTRSIAIDSVLDPTPGGFSNNGLTGTISVIAYDPITGESSAIEGRGFINGYTYAGAGPKLEQWVGIGDDGRMQALDVDRAGTLINPGVGFPGTDDPSGGVIDGSFVGSKSLLSPVSFIFVVDSDSNLATYEAFPQNKVIRVLIRGAESTCTNDSAVAAGVRATTGRVLEEGGVATTEVGGDVFLPAPLLDGPGGTPVTCPRDLEADLACDTWIYYSYSEAWQPYSI